MALSSPENGFEELNDLLKENDPCMGNELDPNYIVNKEEIAADYHFGNLASSNDLCGDENENEQQNPLSLSNEFSFYDFCRSPQHIFDDVLGDPKFVGDEERLLSSPKECYHQHDAEDLHSDYFSRSSFQVEPETIHNKPYLVSENYGTEEQELEDRLASPFQEGKIEEGFLIMSTYGSPKSELANKEIEDDLTDIPTEKLHLSMTSATGNDESESEHMHFVKNSSAESPKSELAKKEIEGDVSDIPTEKLHISMASPTENDESESEHMHFVKSSSADIRTPETSPAVARSPEVLHSHQLSPSKSPQVSKSPDRVKQLSFTHDMSPCTYLSPGSPKTTPSPQSIQESPYSSRLHRQRRHSSTEGSDHLIPYDKEKPASPSGTKRGAHHMDDSSAKHIAASPRSHHSHQIRRKRDRSVSRSPVRRMDPSFRHKREHHERSRSRSPHRRHYHRRSPRRHHSPRRRSPPPSYRSHRRSPRRHWSPPHNRSTGLGKPGRNLFVAGFSFLTTERDLERKFSRFGRVRDVRIVRNKRSGDSRGFGFLTLERDEDADAAIRALDKTEWNGRIVLVEKTKPH